MKSAFIFFRKNNDKNLDNLAQAEADKLLKKMKKKARHDVL